MKFSFLCLIFLSLYSCGFNPLYSDSNRLKTQNIISQIKLINNIDKKSFSLNKKIIYQNFKNQLNIDTNNYSNIKYTLQVNDIYESDYPLDLDMDGNASEYNYKITINITLQNIENKKIIFNKNYSSEVNLSIKDAYYSSLISKRNYQEILAIQIAKDLQNYILLLSFDH